MNLDTVLNTKINFIKKSKIKNLVDERIKLNKFYQTKHEQQVLKEKKNRVKL